MRQKTIDFNRLYQAQDKLDQEIIERKHLQHKDLRAMKLLALYTELGELAQEVQGLWKYWKSHTERDDEKVLDEFVDCLHFALSIGLDNHSFYDGSGGGYPVIEADVATLFDIVYLDLNRFIGSRDDDDYKMFIDDLMGLGHFLKLTDDQIYNHYFEKNEINHERQEVNY